VSGCVEQLAVVGHRCGVAAAAAATRSARLPPSDRDRARNTKKRSHHAAADDGDAKSLETMVGAGATAAAALLRTVYGSPIATFAPRTLCTVRTVITMMEQLRV